MGVGSSILGDDAAGLFFVEQLKEKLKKIKKRLPLKLFSCGTVPENYTGEIKKFNPTHIIIIDAASMNEEAGEVRILDKEDICDDISFSTHRPHRKVLIEYLCRSLNCTVISVAVQAKTLDFGAPKAVDANAPLSCEVEKAVKSLVDIMADLISVKLVS